jgi:AraC family transcriptional regulator
MTAKAVKRMGYREDMARCRDYIAAHAGEEITAAGLASLFGYSFYHFCHVFKSCNEMSVGAYLRDIRLSRAADEITGGRRITDAALDWGFDTPSGFTRAFRRRCGMSPTEFKKRKGGKSTMKPEIKKMDAFTAVGYSLAPPAGELDVLDHGAYWLGKDFSAVSKEDYAKLCAPDCAEIGAWLHPSDKTGEFCYFFGPVTKDKSFVPAGMVALDVPAAEYAVFPVPAAASAAALNENVKKTWKFIFNDWFDGSGYQFDHSAMDFEYYRGAETFIYVPVVKK